MDFSVEKQTPKAPHANNSANKDHLGMAWYKFLIYFALIAGAVLNIIASLSYISGGIYFVGTNGRVSAEEVYDYYGIGLQVVDVLYGIFIAFFAILALVLRQKLATHKPDSIKFVKIYYSLSAGVPFLYAAVGAAITGQSLAVNAVIEALFGLFFLFANIAYFKKRAHLFVNQTVSVQSSSQPQIQFRPVLNCDENSVVSSPAVERNEKCVFCTECGTKLHTASRFCRMCGTKIISSAPPEEQVFESKRKSLIEKLALLTVELPTSVAKNSQEKLNIVKNEYTYCEAIIFSEFFIRANVLDLLPSSDAALKFSDEYIAAVINGTIKLLPEVETFFANMFMSRATLYDKILLNSEKPTDEIIAVLSHIIHQESDENKYVEATEKTFRYFGGLLENLTIRAELVTLFGCIHSCSRETVDELKEYFNSASL
jgi:hypothetical protein